VAGRTRPTGRPADGRSAGVIIVAALLALAACTTSVKNGGSGGVTASGEGGASAGGLAAPAASPAPALRPVRLAYSAAAASFAPLWAAYEYGFFEQNGLRASEPLYVDGGPANIQALVAHELEGSYMAFSPVVSAITSGAPITAVASFGRGFTHQLFAKANSGVTRAADMPGRRAGVSTPGSETNTVVQLWARANGLRDEEITYVNAGTGAERLAMLDAGAVDLAAITPEVAPVAKKQGYVLVADLAQEPVPWQREALVLPEDLVRNDPALATALTRALSEAAYLLHADPQRFDTVVSKYVKLDDPEALAAAFQAARQGWNPHGRPDPANVRAVQDFVQATIPGAAQEPYSRFVDLTSLDALEKEGFFGRLEQRYPTP
jgi:NitT/TauT family transport system substrate-binding protein